MSAPNPAPVPPGSEAAQLPPFNLAATCPKCGWWNIGTMYHNTATHNENWQLCKKPHLDRHCMLCHYEWQEACIDDVPPVDMRPRTGAGGGDAE